MRNETISQVSLRLKALLHDGMPSKPTVGLRDPSATEKVDVCLWLYQVAVDEFGRNAPPPPAETADGRTVRYRLPPLPVTLYYLLAPLTDEPEKQQQHLAEAMLVFHENSAVRVPDPAADNEVAEVVRVGLLPDTLDDRARLWDSIDRPYRLSVCYQVRSARLVSKRAEAAGTVGRFVVEPPAEARR